MGATAQPVHAAWSGSYLNGALKVRLFRRVVDGGRRAEEGDGERDIERQHRQGERAAQRRARGGALQPHNIAIVVLVLAAEQRRVLFHVVAVHGVHAVVRARHGRFLGALQQGAGAASGMAGTPAHVASAGSRPRGGTSERGRLCVRANLLSSRHARSFATVTVGSRRAGRPDIRTGGAVPHLVRSGGARGDPRRAAAAPRTFDDPHGSVSLGFAMQRGGQVSRRRGVAAAV